MWSDPDREYLQKRGYITPSPALGAVGGGAYHPHEKKLLDLHAEVVNALQ